MTHSEEQRLREEMCQIGALLWLRDLIGAGEGNISCRLGEDRFLCTPSGRSKGHLKPKDLLVIDGEANVVTSGSSSRMGFRDSSSAQAEAEPLKPSSEIKMHLGLYRQRPDAMAVVHAHPVTATGFSLAGETIPDDLMPEAAEFLGPVALVPFATPGTDEVPDGLAEYSETHKTFLLANHGAVVLGKDLTDAFDRMEILERVARVVFVARTLGTPRPMPQSAFLQMVKTSLNGKL